jgi:deoxycytidine triphosphate deaminase
MYLTDVDLRKAIESGKLICEPRPESIEATSIDLHLDHVDGAMVWDVERYQVDQSSNGSDRPELRICDFKLGPFSAQYLTSPPPYDVTSNRLVQRRNQEVIVRTGGFLLWQTKEKVGTPTDDAELICFVDGKSTRARAGIVVHLTAPTIHSSWAGQITLEIANLGPFDLVLQEDDVVAQLTVARVSCPPQRTMSMTSQTFQQTSVGGHRKPK